MKQSTAVQPLFPVNARVWFEQVDGFGRPGLYYGEVIEELTSILRRVQVDGGSTISLCIWEMRQA